jgi:hypothetical protein
VDDIDAIAVALEMTVADSADVLVLVGPEAKEETFAGELEEPVPEPSELESEPVA